MKFQPLLFIALLFSFSHFTLAKTYSWPESVEETTKSNEELNAAKKLLNASSFQVSEARSVYFPQISASAGVNHGTSLISTDPKNSFNTSITATENLFSGFADSAKIDQAKLSKLSAEINLEVVKAKISFNLKSAFMGLLYSQKYIKLTEDIIKRRAANLRLVQLRFESGRENIGSINLSKAYLTQSKYDNTVAIHSLDLTRAQLAQVLGLEDYNVDTNLDVNGEVPVNDPQSLMNEKLNLKDLIQSVPEYKKALVDENNSKASIDLSKSAFFPSLNLSQSATRSGYESSPANKYWSIGATLTFPLFSGGKDYFSYKSASETYRAAVMTSKNTQSTTLAKIKELYNAYVEAVMKLEVDRSFVTAWESRDRIATAQYNNGLITFTDWDNIENELIISQKSLLQSERDRVIAEAAYEQALGKGVIQ